MIGFNNIETIKTSKLFTCTRIEMVMMNTLSRCLLQILTVVWSLYAPRMEKVTPCASTAIAISILWCQITALNNLTTIVA